MIEQVISKQHQANITETSLIRRPLLVGKSILSTWQNLAGLRCWAWRSFTIWRWRRCQCPRNLGCPFVHSSGCCALVRVEFCWEFRADENDRKRQWRSDKFCQLSRRKTWDWWLFCGCLERSLRSKTPGVPREGLRVLEHHPFWGWCQKTNTTTAIWYARCLNMEVASYCCRGCCVQRRKD